MIPGGSSAINALTANIAAAEAAPTPREALRRLVASMDEHALGLSHDGRRWAEDEFEAALAAARKVLG